MTTCLFTYAQTRTQWTPPADADPVLLAWAERDVQISCNVKKPTFVADLLEGRSMPTARDAAGSSEEFRRRQGPYADRRDAFETRYLQGERFRYGALNGGTIGPSGRPEDYNDGYGPYCLVLKAPTPEQAQQIALSLCDSLRGFTRLDQTLDYDSFEIAVGGWGHRAGMAAVKLSGVLEPDWPGELCRGLIQDALDYIEAIFLRDPLTLDQFEGVRLSAEADAQLGVWAKQAPKQKPPPEASEEEARAYAAGMIRTAILKGKLKRLKVSA